MTVEIRELVLRARIISDEEPVGIEPVDFSNDESRRAELVALIDARIRAAARRAEHR